MRKDLKSKISAEETANHQIWQFLYQRLRHLSICLIFIVACAQTGTIFENEIENEGWTEYVWDTKVQCEIEFHAVNGWKKFG